MPRLKTRLEEVSGERERERERTNCPAPLARPSALSAGTWGQIHIQGKRWGWGEEDRRKQVLMETRCRNSRIRSRCRMIAGRIESGDGGLEYKGCAGEIQEAPEREATGCVEFSGEILPP